MKPFDYRIQWDVLTMGVYVLAFVIGLWAGRDLAIPNRGHEVKTADLSNFDLPAGRGLDKTSTPSESRKLPPSSYLESDWRLFPATLVREAVGLDVTPLFFLSQTGYNEFHGDLGRKKLRLTDNEFTGVLRALQKALKQWAEMVGATAVPQGNGTWKIHGNPSRLPGIQRELESELNLVLGQERAHILRCVIFASLSHYFSLDVGTISLGERNSVTLSLSTESRSSLTFDRDGVDSRCPMATLLTFLPR